MHPQTDRSQGPHIARAFGAALVAGWVIGAAAVVAGFGVLARDQAGMAVLGAGAALVGVVAGLAALAPGLSRTRIEPGFMVLGASILRAIAGLVVGVAVERASGAPAAPFWIGWLVAMGAVLVAEVVAAYRVLGDAPRESLTP